MSMYLVNLCETDQFYDGKFKFLKKLSAMFTTDLHWNINSFYMNYITLNEIEIFFEVCVQCL